MNFDQESKFEKKWEEGRGWEGGGGVSDLFVKLTKNPNLKQKGAWKRSKSGGGGGGGVMGGWTSSIYDHFII